IGVLHLLKLDDVSDYSRELIDEALACGDMLAQLLNDVLDFSKIEAGKLELHLEAIDPAAALHGVAEMLRHGAEARGLYLRTRIDSDP
ncbi:histidine kinase dimerization/phospho-acceptor domain-containing protein, partial [Acinetobacter baumannii]